MSNPLTVSPKAIELTRTVLTPFAHENVIDQAELETILNILRDGGSWAASFKDRLIGFKEAMEMLGFKERKSLYNLIDAGKLSKRTCGANRAMLLFSEVYQLMQETG